MKQREMTPDFIPIFYKGRGHDIQLCLNGRNFVRRDILPLSPALCFPKVSLNTGTEPGEFRIDGRGQI